MTNRTKTLVSCCTAMAAGGLANSQLAYTELATAPFIRAGIVGIIAATIALTMLLVLPPRKVA
jgi:hypothetical protein